MKKAYHSAFTATNGAAGFRKTGIFPLDEMKLVGKARPFSSIMPHIVASVEDMCDMLETKRKLLSAELLKCPTEIVNGFIDMSEGCVLTSEEAMALARREEKVRRGNMET